MMKAMTLVAVSAVALTAGTASAATFSGNTYGYFSHIENADHDVFPYNYYSNGGFNGSSTGIAWGYTDTSDTDFFDTSQLGINDTLFSCELTTGMQSCDVAKIDWYNAASNASTTDEDFNVDARLRFNLDTPVDLDTQYDTLQLNILSTNNTLSPTSDLIVSGDWEQFFLQGYDLGNGYTLHGFSLRHEGAGALHNVAGTDFEWTNPENSVSHLYIVADIKGPAPIPLPAAGWMLLAGVGAMAAFRRRRKA